MHVEYGIVVYPSALTEDIDVQGLGVDVTFTDAYSKHISMFTKSRNYSLLIAGWLTAFAATVMFDRCSSSCHPPPCPLEYFQEPPPVYEK